MDEKKKVMVMGALFAVVIGVGAFQFSSVGGPTESASVKDKAKKEKAFEAAKKKSLEDEAKGSIVNPLYAQNLPVRDPFEPGPITEAPSDVTNPRQIQPTQERPANIASNIRPFNTGLTGQLPATTPNGNTNVGLSNSSPLRQPGELAYSLKGVLLGEKPAAVLTDDNGNQRLIALGDSIDGDSRVTQISQGKVTVRHKGKTVTLTVGANTNEK